MSQFLREATEGHEFEASIWQHSEFLFEKKKEVGSGEAETNESILAGCNRRYRINARFATGVGVSAKA